ncbi:adenosine deaminase [Flavobacteriaceae bacterium D16]|nr:adenosine deaminase [Flavobacteriaceae bacterium D16]
MAHRSLPKIELHLHLDCSLSFEVARQIKPELSREDYETNFVAPPKCTDLADYLTRAVKGFELMQTREQLHLVTLDLFKQLKADNVIYAEIRFAPLLHTREGLSPEEVVETVLKASLEGIENYGIEARLILCTLRRFNEEQSLQTAKLVHNYRGTLVAGMDIAGDEAGYPIDAHLKAFNYARENEIKCTAHAGEACGAQSVWQTIRQFYPHRIGHGVRSVEDESLLQFIKQQGLHLEVCPTSNIQVNVFDRIENHPVDMLYKKGLSLSINTDARTISDTTLEKEYQKLADTFGWTLEQFKYCNLEAIEHAFAPEALKAQIRKRLLNAYQ